MGILHILSEVCKNFGKKTSIAGLNHAVNSSSHLRRFAWLSIFFILMVFTFQTFLDTVLDFTSYPVLTSVNVTRKFNLPFPAVTICNLNRVQCTNLVYTQYQESEKMKLSPTNGTIDTVQLLNELVDLTKCLEQLCNKMNKFVGPVRVGPLGNYVDTTLLAIANLKCPVSIHIGRNCYYYKSIEEEAYKLNNTELYNRSIEAWNYQKCKAEEACSYKPQSDVPLQVRFEPLKFCEGKKFKTPSLFKGKFTKRHKNPLVMVEEAKFFNIFFKLPIYIQNAIGHQFESKLQYIHQYELTTKGFILSCQYRGESCLEKNASWTMINLPRYGNCYTLNSMNYPYNKLQSTSLTGAANGIELSFFVDQDNYIVSRLSEKAGVRIIIHEPGDFPLPDENGIDLQPGTATSIAIQKSDIIRLPKPYKSECFSNWSETPYENMTLDHPSYSIIVCQRICLQKWLKQKCGCTHPHIRQIGGFSKRKICNITPDAKENMDYKCFLEFIERFDNGSYNCQCNVACLEVDYSCQNTVSTWPSNEFWETLALELNLIDENLLPLPETLENKFRTDIQKNFVKTDIYYQTMSVKVIEQIPKYSYGTFIAGLGGSLSLYLGIAIIMIFEILEFIIDLFSRLGYYFVKGNKVKIISIKNRSLTSHPKY
ncbi:epithelial sodium channel subunit gamma-like [Lepeophtheirus salmonis]|uniref:epithelial sodium channel subunit gamma-like n=1 Tax=Lepeophtheirus salmonis TaxID=72036 RepID=UPI001AE335FE|nr:FMRFamide-activated amiloride-sensitive sodium channel-like [Lepeophtheirus salmonis]